MALFNGFQWIEAASQRPAYAQEMLRGLALDGQ